MSLFKILRGDSSRISTDITPFHEGYAYFCPNNGTFHIDAIVNEEQKRVQVGTSSFINATLTVDGWSNKQQTIFIENLKAEQNGLASISQGLTDDQYEIVVEANIYIISQSDGEITFAVGGDIPIIDIPITIILLG